MYTVINFELFKEAFERKGRGDQFSEIALEALFHYITIIETDTEQQFSLDVVELCCNFVEIGTSDHQYQEYIDGDIDMIAKLPDGALFRRA